MIDGESIRIDDRDDRIIIFLPTRELTAESTRRLVPASEVTNLNGRNVGIELRPLRFVRPFGLIYLYWYIRWLLDQQGALRVDVVLDGSNRDLCNYIKRMKLPAVFGDVPVTIYPIQNLQLKQSDLTDSLVELTSFRVDDDNEVEEEDGRLVIRSGSGQVAVESGWEDARNDCSPLPGTLVEVAFPT